MKALYITGISSSKYGGFERFIVELAKQGVDLTLVYNEMPLSSDYVNDLKALGVDICIANGPFKKRLIETCRIIKKSKPEIIHYHFGLSVYFLFLYVKVFYPNIRQVLTQHCEFLYTGRLMIFLSRICYRSLDLVISVSEGVNRKLRKILGDSNKFIVSYLGVARRAISNYNVRKEWGISSDTVVITSIGFDINVKGFDLLAKAVSLLLDDKKLPKIKIIVIGLCEEESRRYRNLLIDLGIEDYFILPGIRNDIDNFLNITDIYVQPSRTEAISLSIMEALMYSIPIIGSDVGGISEVCHNGINGFLFEKNDYMDLYSKLRMLICDYNLRKRLGCASLSLSKDFNVEDNVKKLIQIYKSLI